MSACDLVHGAWTRRSVSIDGGPHFETQMVVWLQAGTRYADLRVPLHPLAERRCFTGRSGWEIGDSYRWTHMLDLDGSDSPAADDVGSLKWEDGALVERGLFPTKTGSVSYEEVWVRLPDADGPWLVLESPVGCLIRVGDHAITVIDRRADGGEFAAAYRVREPTGWRLTASIGAGDALPGPRDPPVGWAVVHSGESEVVDA